MESFRKVTGVAAPMLRINIDTDQIIPALFLGGTDAKGYGANLFHGQRFKADGSPNPDFVLNQPPYDQAQVLLADRNFGCGSSRERAPKALREFGFRAIVAPSYGGIFFNNRAGARDCRRGPVRRRQGAGHGRSRVAGSRLAFRASLSLRSARNPSANAVAGDGRNRHDALAPERDQRLSDERQGAPALGLLVAHGAGVGAGLLVAKMQSREVFAKTVFANSTVYVYSTVHGHSDHRVLPVQVPAATPAMQLARGGPYKHRSQRSCVSNHVPLTPHLIRHPAMSAAIRVKIQGCVVFFPMSS